MATTIDIAGMTVSELEELRDAVVSEIDSRTANQMRTIVCRAKDLNSRGNGAMQTRRVRLPSGETGWASDLAEDLSGHWESGSYLASQRRCTEKGDFPVGTLVIEYESGMRGGSKTGSASVRAGIIVDNAKGQEVRLNRGFDDGKSDIIEWGLKTKGRGKDVSVRTPAGDWVSI